MTNLCINELLKKINKDEFYDHYRDCKFVTALVDKFVEASTSDKVLNAHEIYDDSELDYFWCIEEDKFVACWNVEGDCYVEEFDSINSVMLYLMSDLELEIILTYDKTQKLHRAHRTHRYVTFNDGENNTISFCMDRPIMDFVRYAKQHPKANVVSYDYRE